MYNDYMYAIDRSDEYLEHYGIKGMKWGVRKAIDAHNTKALLRHYRKAQKKLAKLDRRANNGAKYAKRAAALGAGAAAAGGLAALGTSGVGSLIRKGSGVAGKAIRGVGGALEANGAIIQRGGKAVGNNAAAITGHRIRYAGKKLSNFGNAAEKSLHGAGRAVTRWGQSQSISKAVTKAANSPIDAGLKGLRDSGLKGQKLATSLVVNDHVKNARKVANVTSGMTNGAMARVGAGALAAGLAGAAGYNAYRAATTKRAAKKAAEFRKEMNETFKGTGVQRMASKNRRRRSRG